MADKIRENDVVVLIKDIRERRLSRGEIGTVVEIVTKRVESQATRRCRIVLSDVAKSHIDLEKAARHSNLQFLPRPAKLDGFAEPQNVWGVNRRSIGAFRNTKTYS